jgi:hypothetical protein
MCMLRQSIINGACSGGTIALICGNNQVRINNQCVCAVGYIMVAGACYKTCGANAYLSNAVCVCLPGYTLSSAINQCVKTPNCESNFINVNGVCVCPQELKQVGTQCI